MGNRGFALLLAIGTLLGLTAIVLTAGLLAQSESRSGLAALARVEAQAAAMTAATDALEGWNESETPLVPGEERRIVTLTGSGPAEGTATVRSLGGPIYAIRAIGVRRDHAGSAIGYAGIEVLILLDSTISERVTPRVYPRGWRILP
jgi:hypothetical protein